MKIINSMPFRLKALAIAIVSSTSTVYGFEIETGNPDLRLSLGNTIKYSTAFRTKDASSGLTEGSAATNYNDGDNNFDKGMVSSRLDLFSEFDLSYKDAGIRISGAAWYDDVYHQDTDNSSTTSNHSPANEFSDTTKKVMGGDAEILDAFVYSRFPVMNGMDGTIRVGRHTLLWGESLFFGSNGIAGGQGPVDAVKLSSVPNSTFKETMRPTGKVSVDIPISETVSLGAYVGYEWEASRLLPAGSYLSIGDTLVGEKLLAGPYTATHTSDDEGSDSGQYGLQLKWSDFDIDADFGLYAIRFDASSPSNNVDVILDSSFHPSQYKWAYAKGIEAYGFSMAKTVGIWSLAGEVSYRFNAPLASTSQTITPNGVQYDNDKNPGYAVGETAHAQFSWLASLGPNFLSKESSFVGEIAWNTRVKTTKNEDMLNPYADKSAVGLRIVYSPTYRQAFDGVDLSPSVGFSHTWGKSSAVGPSFGVDDGGDINVGLNAVYLNRWNASLNYIKYLGEEGIFNDSTNNYTYKQTLKDRDFISASVSTTF
ncbi:MAG: DUF1302 domain-containing protein [Gammaproteobacteria bacterium]|nr:DUF1302 domain-containing protein [Gammaproteobacteria bacterium]MBU1467413.1 DUF1302 domain-containing protein [Gammaproteobacteria bacterium]MBU2024074.1 DUF1302 domain-containing protein [Gammaproteobacteria bacterium]MBU2238362.1 DUF1302 domain-containing protein [Gammaproteobacteria bacterium]MBU2319120.1 DUF1302 domain-containing protein [Gammaproteobacteria bacterium]